MEFIKKIQEVQSGLEQMTVQAELDKKLQAEKIKSEAEIWNKRQSDREGAEKEMADRVLEESGVLKMLIEIDTIALVNSTLPHQIRQTAGGFHNNELELIWDIYHLDRIDRHKSINIFFISSNNTLQIIGKEKTILTEDQWKDKTTVENTLIKAFANPELHQFISPIDEPFTGGGGYM